jgi:hypothetical protein
MMKERQDTDLAWCYCTSDVEGELRPSTPEFYTGITRPKSIRKMVVWLMGLCSLCVHFGKVRRGC